MTKDEPQIALDFEQALAELEALLERMERGELSLEDSLEHYERGVELGRACQRALDSAEQRIRILARRDGALQPFEPEREDENEQEDEQA